MHLNLRKFFKEFNKGNKDFVTSEAVSLINFLDVKNSRESGIKI